MYTGKVKSINQDRIVETGERFMSIELDIFDENGEFVVTKKLGFNIGTTKEDLKVELKKHIDAVEKEILDGIKNREIDEQDKNFSEVEKELKDLDI